MKRLRVAWFGMLALCACGHEPAAAGPRAVPPAASAPLGDHTIVVFATASLRAPFAALARRYEQVHPGGKVVLRCDGGAELLAAMNAGEQCDVLAIGDNSLMSRFSSAAHLAGGSPAELARNRVAIVVAAGNPKRVESLADLGRSGVRVALGSRSSSIGRHGRWVLSRQHLDLAPACEAATADGVLAQVAAGQADAGIVYATTLVGAGAAVQQVTVPDADNTAVLYSISATRLSSQRRGADAFRALALGAEGQQILHDAGFLPIGAKLP